MHTTWPTYPRVLGPHHATKLHHSICDIDTSRHEQTRARQLESNLVRPLTQKTFVQPRDSVCCDAAGCQPRNSAVKQEGQDCSAIGQ